MADCAYCGEQCRPLFRICETYECGDEMDLFHKCDSCSYAEFMGEDKECSGCEFKPFHMINTLNLTIAIVGGKLMFEDKAKGYLFSEEKRYLDINFCPMCGRKLKERL